MRCCRICQEASMEVASLPQKPFACRCTTACHVPKTMQGKENFAFAFILFLSSSSLYNNKPSTYLLIYEEKARLLWTLATSLLQAELSWALSRLYFIVPCLEDVEHFETRENTNGTWGKETMWSKAGQMVLWARKVADRWHWQPGRGGNIRQQPPQTWAKWRATCLEYIYTFVCVCVRARVWLQLRFSHLAGKGRWQDRNFFKCFNKRWTH